MVIRRGVPLADCDLKRLRRRWHVDVVNVSNVAGSDDACYSACYDHYILLRLDLRIGRDDHDGRCG
jgi:hypothetical protein